MNGALARAGGVSSRPRDWQGSALIVTVVASSLGAWALTGNPLLAFAPVTLLLVAWGLTRAPAHKVALALFFLAVVTDNPKEHPAEDRWASPLKPLGVWLYENLNNLTGVQALRFSVADLLLGALLLVALLRDRSRDSVPAPRALHVTLAVAWLAVVWLEVWGIARGGDFKASLWQARPLFWAPVIAYVLAAGLRGPRDHAALGKLVIGAALVKAAFGLYYYFVICRPQGYQPAHATTHSDTVLFVTAAAVAAAYWIEVRTPRASLEAIAVLFFVLLGIIVNGRRLAYVSLAGTIVALRFVLPADRLRRLFDRALLAAAPLGAIYLALGWSSNASIFGPARKIASLFSSSDRSSLMRDIENYNLILTSRKHLLLGSGFGHPYDELVRPEGIDRIFPLYRYIGHNSILWLESAGGFVGFTAFWMMLAVLAYFAARSHRFAATPIDRAAAIAAIAVVVVFGVQAHGDMGLASWTAVFFLGLALAVTSKLAVASGAYPAGR